MWRFLLSTICIFLLLSCDLGDNIEPTPLSEAIETQVPNIEPADELDETDESEPIVGCDWVSGPWVLTDCQNNAFDVVFHTAGQCTVQAVSAHPSFMGAFGQAQDSGLSLVLPAIGGMCQGAFDGAILHGACGTRFSSPCAFQAVPADYESEQ